MKTRWLPIEGFHGRYHVSECGMILSFHSGNAQVMQQYTHYKGHKFVFLCLKGIRTKFFVHRLVAIAFIPNPTNSPIVNHKNMDKAHNHVSNLEWCTIAENTQHYYDNRTPQPAF